jgi:hypothetical protein
LHPDIENPSIESSIMKNKKEIQPHTGGKKISPQTAELISEKQESYAKSEQKNFPVIDERALARKVHTNGSTPRKDS